MNDHSGDLASALAERALANDIFVAADEWWLSLGAPTEAETAAYWSTRTRFVAACREVDRLRDELKVTYKNEREVIR